MIFWQRFERARRAQQELNREQGIRPANEEGEPELEKHDLFAMCLSAMITILPAALGVLLVMVGVAWLLFH